MDYQIDGISGFESRKVVVRSAGIFSGPKLLVDDEVIKGSWENTPCGVTMARKSWRV